MIDQRLLEEKIKTFSDWVDLAPANANRDREALMWHRTAKVSEEAGEVIDEVIQAVGGNPRKPSTGHYDAVVKELYDTANAALGAIVHIRGTGDGLLDGLYAHVQRVNDRVGLDDGRTFAREAREAMLDAQPPIGGMRDADPPLPRDGYDPKASIHTDDQM